jgi:hypothetical protein
VAIAWFDEMERRYAELEPFPANPVERKKWVTRCHKWATSIDPEGSRAAFEAMCEEGVAQGLLVRTGFDAEGRQLYRRTDKRGDDNG